MALFKSNSKQTFEYSGIVFNVFHNTNELFDAYNKQQTNMMFTNCFEYVNKNALNSKYMILYIVVDGIFYLYIYHKNKDYIISYNFDSYQYLLDEYGIETEIKFMAQFEIDSISNECRVGIEIVDAIYNIDNLCEMVGKKYVKLRQRRNNFVNHNADTIFRPYTNADKFGVLNLYGVWKEDKKANDSMICDARIFKDGLDSEYLIKFVLTLSDGSIIGFASFYFVREWCYMYSMKTLRDKGALRNTNVYLVHLLWNHIRVNYKDIKWINLGGMDTPGWEDDFKEQLKPDIYLKNYINVKIKDV